MAKLIISAFLYFVFYKIALEIFSDYGTTVLNALVLGITTSLLIRSAHYFYVKKFNADLFLRFGTSNLIVHCFKKTWLELLCYIVVNIVLSLFITFGFSKELYHYAWGSNYSVDSGRFLGFFVIVIIPILFDYALILTHFLPQKKSPNSGEQP